jgi:alpha/beta superfamily hydrolase
MAKSSYQTEKLLISGPSGQLEAELSLPNAYQIGAPVAVVCHPHSLYGGSLRNKVVHILADTFTELGLPTLRFNFRGVGKSEGKFDQGQGEQEDLKSAIAWLQARFEGAPLWLAGFSFGAYVAYQAHRSLTLDRLLLVAPPISLFVFGQPEPVTIPWMVIQGSQDEIVPAKDVENWVSAQANPPEFHLMQDASHFFHGRLNDLRSLVLASVADECRNMT